MDKPEEKGLRLLSLGTFLRSSLSLHGETLIPLENRWRRYTRIVYAPRPPEHPAFGSRQIEPARSASSL